MIPLAETFIILVTALLSVAIAVLFLRFGQSSHKAALNRDTVADVAYLFEGDSLCHATDAALQRFPEVVPLSPWHALRDTIAHRFSTLPQGACDICDLAPVTLRSDLPADPAKLTLQRRGQFTQVLLDENPGSDRPDMAALQAALAQMRLINNATPHPVWLQGDDGTVRWFNAAYEKVFHQTHGMEPRPDRPLFEHLAIRPNQTDPIRAALSSQAPGPDTWYDVTATRFDDVTLCHAVNVNALVDAQTAQRNFVQTLAKTFAQLSTGLAIFDRNRQLVLFNPALIDLTGLPVDLLSSKPSLMTFFDRLRDSRQMPEPKNYASWREKIDSVIAQAADGRFQENWALENGRTYAVSGRPHPDGAIAFLIEDISAEIALTRSYRKELEMSQSLIDGLDEALVVFSSSGILTCCNAAYRQMWSVDPDGAFADVTVRDSVAVWEQQCQSQAPWDALIDFTLQFRNRAPWKMPIRRPSGETLTCLVTPIFSGATLVRFVVDAKAEQPDAKADKARLDQL